LTSDLGERRKEEQCAKECHGTHEFPPNDVPSKNADVRQAGVKKPALEAQRRREREPTVTLRHETGAEPVERDFFPAVGLNG
jgi:hypothetical protein